MRTLLLDAIRGDAVASPPIWLMRQAGRYLPSYQALRKNHDLLTLFQTPELAARITCLPLETFDFDAAILFSDILVIAQALGLTLTFSDQKGPQILPKVTLKDPLSLVKRDVGATLAYVFETILKVRKEISVPLIGFCGGAFTVASYLIEEPILEWMVHAPGKLHALLNQITEVTETYLALQIQSGVDLIQIFDSWADLLDAPSRKMFCYPYAKQLIQVGKKRGVPVIFFCRGAELIAEELIALGADVVSVGANKPLAKVRASLPSTVGLQGNFDPEFLLRATSAEVGVQASLLRASMEGKKRWIAGLGHGVLPGTPVDNVHAFVQAIRSPTT